MSNELAWLDDNWIPEKIVHHTNVCTVGMSGEEFDEKQAKEMGYESFEDMVSHNFESDKQTYLKYGDRTKGLI